MHVQVCCSGLANVDVVDESQHGSIAAAQLWWGKRTPLAEWTAAQAAGKLSATPSLLCTPSPRTTPAHLHQKKDTTASLTEQSSPQPCLGAQRATRMGRGYIHEVGPCTLLRRCMQPKITRICKHEVKGPALDVVPRQCCGLPSAASCYARRCSYRVAVADRIWRGLHITQTQWWHQSAAWRCLPMTAWHSDRPASPAGACQALPSRCQST
jgi:hypothetical protein